MDRSTLRAYICDVKQLSEGFKNCRFQHVLRKPNDLTHFLAKKGLKRVGTMTEEINRVGRQIQIRYFKGDKWYERFHWRTHKKDDNAKSFSMSYLLF